MPRSPWHRSSKRPVSREPPSRVSASAPSRNCKGWPLRWPPLLHAPNRLAPSRLGPPPVPTTGSGRIPFFQSHQREGIMEAVNTVTHSEKNRRRVLLKLSGEVFGGGKLGVDPE